MVFQMPTHREILKYNRHLPDEYKNCSVALEFSKEIPSYMTENFYRVRMTKDMLASGEGTFWIPEIIQPNSSGLQKCLGCEKLTQRIGVMSTVCTNLSCAYSGKTLINGPKRGVHSIKVEFDVTNHNTGQLLTVSFITGRDWKTVDMDVWINIGLNKLRKKGFIASPIGNFDEDVYVDSVETYLKWPQGKIPIDLIQGCLLVLDRRYDDSVLCAVYRTCGELCDLIGIKLK